MQSVEYSGPGRATRHGVYIEALERRVLFDATGVDQIDPTWGNGGSVGLPNTFFPSNITAGDDGRVVVIGMGGAGNVPAVQAFRFNHNGALDSSFGTAGLLSANLPYEAWTILGAGLTRDLHLMIAIKGHALGGAGQPKIGTDQFRIYMFNNAGVLDPHFGHHGVVKAPVGKWQPDFAQVESDGRVVLAGDETSNVRQPIESITPTGSLIKLAQYTARGHLNHSFGSDGMFKVPLSTNESVAGMKLAPSGSILLTATITVARTNIYNDSNTQQALVRVTPRGKMDKSFGHNGSLYVSATTIAAVLPTPDEEIVVNSGTSLQDLSADGMPDFQFGTAGIATFAAADQSAIAVDVALNGQILAVSAGTSNMVLDRFSSTGALISQTSNPVVSPAPGQATVGIIGVVQVVGDRSYVLQTTYSIGGGGGGIVTNTSESRLNNAFSFIPGTLGIVAFVAPPFRFFNS